MPSFRAGPVAANALTVDDPGQIGDATDKTGAHNPGGWSPAAIGNPRLNPQMVGNAEVNDPGPALPAGQSRFRALRPLTGSQNLDGAHDATLDAPRDTAWTGTALSGAPPADPEVATEHGPRRGPWSSHVIGALGTDDPRSRVPMVTDAAVARMNTTQEVDPRRVDGNQAPIIPAAFAPVPVTEMRNPSDRVDRAPELRPNEVRAGDAVGQGNYGRPATVPRYLFMRPFDQWAAQHLTGQKGVIGPPDASLPIRTQTEAPGKAPAPGMDPTGQAHPNTYRAVPMPWDTSLVDSATRDAGDTRVARWRSG